MSTVPRPVPIRHWEASLTLVVLALGGIVIFVLVLVSGVVRTVAAIAHDPNAGPYRQVR